MQFSAFSETSVISYEDGQIRLRVSSVAEARIAIKELKIKKKELSLLKRELAAQQKELRSAHTQAVRARGPMMRGGGSFGKVIRAMQSISRNSTRASVANSLAPVEDEKVNIDRDMRGLESLILQLENFITKNG
jgi:hypothetical protein